MGVKLVVSPSFFVREVTPSSLLEPPNAFV
jgi:hypothetical protein